MNDNAKKILLNMVYYTTIGVMVAFVVFLAITLTSVRVNLTLKIGYYIVIGALAGLVIFDIICTATKSSKYIAGFILYGLTLATIAMSFVAYSYLAIDGALATNVIDLFFMLVSMSYAINIFAIIIYCVGESLIQRQ